MIGPRDTVFASVPVNQLTGQPLSKQQQDRLENIQSAGDGLYEAMHFAEGSNPPDGPYQEHHWQGRRMAIAATHIETALMFARKAALEV